MRPAAAGRGAAVIALLLGIVGGGIGWLYVLHDAGALGAGPRVPEALPLQRLAGGAAQPLLRLTAAWLPAGVVAGLVLRRLGYRRRWPRAVLLFAGAALLLLALGAMADAVTASEPLRAHLAAQPRRLTTWIAAATAAVGAAIP